MNAFTSPDDLAAFTRALRDRLRDADHDAAADRLSSVVDAAFTTSSERLGEFGLAVRDIQRQNTVGTESEPDLERIIGQVRGVLPDI